MRDGVLDGPISGPPREPRERGSHGPVVRRRQLTSVAAGPPLPVALFFLAVLVPPQAQFHAGDLMLSMQRVILLLTILPCVVLVLTGGAGRVRLVDALVGSHAIWAIVSFWSVQGPEVGIKTGGIYVVESMGPYLLARGFVRNESSFRGFVRLYVWIVIGLALLTVPEAVSGTHIIAKIFGEWNDVEFPTGGATRLGLTRAFGPFNHPILYGIFCSTALSLAWFSSRRGGPRRAQTAGAGLVALSAAMSVSTVAFLSMAVQTLLIAWGRIFARFRWRWLSLGLFAASFWVAGRFFSQRGALMAIMARIALDPQTAYMRQLQWEYGTAEVLRHPLVGIGHLSWDHPSWMPGSVDNFWLVLAIIHGLPGIISLGAATLGIMIQIGRKRGLAGSIQRLRLGWMISMIGLVVSGATVHYWGTALTFYFFMLGSAVWMLDEPVLRRSRLGDVKSKAGIDARVV